MSVSTCYNLKTPAQDHIRRVAPVYLVNEYRGNSKVNHQAHRNETKTDVVNRKYLEREM